MFQFFIKTLFITLFLSFLSLLTVSFCLADVDTGFFIGGSIGKSFTEIDVNDISNIKDYEFDEDDLSYKLFAGYRPIRFLAIEAGYRDFGSPDYKRANVDRFKSETTAFDVFAVGILPIPFIDIFVKGGAVYWDSDFYVGNTKFNEDDTDFIWGGGIALRIRSISARVEWEQIETDIHDRLGMLSAGISYTF